MVACFPEQPAKHNLGRPSRAAIKSKFVYYIMKQYKYIRWKFVPLAAKDVANVLIPVKIPTWRFRAHYSARRVVTVVRTIAVGNGLQKKMSKVNIRTLSTHPVK